MKVQIITNLFPLPWEKNRAAFNRQQFELLAKRCDVALFAIVPWLACVKNIQAVIPTVRNNIAIEYVWYFYVPKFLRALYPVFLFMTLIFKFNKVRKYKPDCFLFSWAYPDAVAGMFLARMMNIPVVIKVHGSDINLHGKHPLRAAQIVWSMKKAKAVVSVSKDLGAKLVAMGVPESRVKVIYNGVNKEVFFPTLESEAKAALGLDTQRKVVLYIGNILRGKGCVDLLAAFKQVAENDALVDLYYAGPGELAKEIMSEAARVGLGERVVFLGSVHHSTLPNWINACSLVALPSYNEGVPNVLLEAMACGKPVVATKVGGIPEVVPEQAGILVDCGNVESLTKGLNDCLQRDWDRDEITSAVKDLSWENNTQQLQSVLEAAIA